MINLRATQPMRRYTAVLIKPTSVLLTFVTLHIKTKPYGYFKLIAISPLYFKRILAHTFMITMDIHLKLLKSRLHYTILFSLLVLTTHASCASSYLAGEFGGAFSYKENNRFLNTAYKEVTLNKNSYGRVYEWGIAIGSMVTPNNSVEFAYNSRKKYSYQKYTIAIDNSPAIGDQQIKFLGKINNSTFMIFYNYDILSFKRVSIGINTGYGWSYNKVSNLNEYLPNASLEAIINSNNKKTSAYSFGVKVDITLNNRLHLMLGYRYSNLGKFSSGVSYADTNNPGAISHTQQITGNLKINEAYLRLAFFFDR